MAVGCIFYVLLLLTQLLAFTREYAANKDVRRENHHKYTSYYKIKDSLCDIGCDGRDSNGFFPWTKTFDDILDKEPGRPSH